MSKVITFDTKKSIIENEIVMKEVYYEEIKKCNKKNFKRK